MDLSYARNSSSKVLLNDGFVLNFCFTARYVFTIAIPYFWVVLRHCLPVVTSSVERAVSAMSLVKTRLRNKMCDSLLDDCLVTYIERDIFLEVNEEDIIETFMALRKRRPNK
ncbi:TTF-type zinc finger protein with HAT dimerization domain [Zea mays]|uniref:TTF-type zinc finger protein with HAT dimerization domain n=1 Tax=Zea mays TaxID=4577 RepID=A0A1D6PR73_MAIZE|nr:TTF-type zinc finger protein with HAT dimerization domain [Zea mays]